MMKKKGFGPENHGNSEREGKRVGNGEFAGMPQAASMKAYAKSYEFGPGDLDDTMETIDRSNSQAHSHAKKNLSNQH